jgi:hypothetical protein
MHMAHLKIKFSKKKFNRVSQLLALIGSKRHLWAPLDNYNFILNLAFRDDYTNDILLLADSKTGLH